MSNTLNAARMKSLGDKIDEKESQKAEAPKEVKKPGRKKK